MPRAFFCMFVPMRRSLFLAMILGSLVSFAVCPTTTGVNTGSIDLTFSSPPNGGSVDQVTIDTLAGAAINSFTYTASVTGNTVTGTAPTGVNSSTQYEAIYFYFGGVLVDSCKVPGILPVDLISFIATRPYGDERIRVVWVTASEHNCESYELKRTAEGYQSVTTLTECTNSSERVSYNFEDASIEKVYYELSQTDYDGKSENFGVVKVASIDAPDGEPLREYRGNYLGVETEDGEFSVKIYPRKVVKTFTPRI